MINNSLGADRFGKMRWGLVWKGATRQGKLRRRRIMWAVHHAEDVEVEVRFLATP